MEAKNDHKELIMDNYKAKFGEQLKEEENLNTLIAENLGDIRGVT